MRLLGKYLIFSSGMIDLSDFKKLTLTEKYDKYYVKLTFQNDNIDVGPFNSEIERDAFIDEFQSILENHLDLNDFPLDPPKGFIDFTERIDSTLSRSVSLRASEIICVRDKEDGAWITINDDSFETVESYDTVISKLKQVKE